MKTGPNNQVVTTGIVLVRREFQEADRIITILTPDYGKVGLIAKGVRRPRSKLAGGIELFSVSNITYLPGRGELHTLISSRLITHYGNIVKDIKRTLLGYEFLKRITRVTEDAAGEEYFQLLEKTLAGLNDSEISTDLVDLWLSMQLLNVTGHIPNLRTDSAGQKLDATQQYLFDFDEMAFQPQADGPYAANHIKLLRLASATETPTILKQVKDAPECAPDMLALAHNLLRRAVRI